MTITEILFSSCAPYHIFSYACLTGITLWHSFISSPVARKTLTRPQLGSLQGKLFSIYFFMQSALSALCLLTTSNRNARIIFLIDTIGGLINFIVFGPWIVKVMNERFKVELEEGKKYNEPDISDRMKALNKQFLKAHGYSVILNLIIVISVIIYPFMLPSINI